MNMGILGSIKKAVGGAANEYTDAYTWAQDKDVHTICAAMKEAEGMKLNGYSVALREKCEDMTTSELKTLYYEVKDRRQRVTKIGIGDFAMPLGQKNTAGETIGNILVERGVFKKDENGLIRD